MEGESEAKPSSEIVKSVVTANLSNIPGWQQYGVPMSGDRSIFRVLMKSHGFTKSEISTALRELGVVPRTNKLASELRRKELREILSRLIANDSTIGQGPLQVRGAGGLMEKLRALGLKDNHQVITEELANCGFALKHRYDDENDPRLLAALSEVLAQYGIAPASACVVDSNMVWTLYADLQSKGQSLSLSRLRSLLNSLNIQVRNRPSCLKPQQGGRESRPESAYVVSQHDSVMRSQPDADQRSAIVRAAIQDQLKNNPLWQKYGVPKGQLIQTIRKITGCSVLAAQTAVASIDLPAQGQEGKSKLRRDQIINSINAVMEAHPQLRLSPIIIRGKNGILPLLRAAGCNSNHAVVSSVMKGLGMEIAGVKDPRFVVLSCNAEKKYPNKWLKSPQTIENVKAKILFDTSFATKGATTAEFRDYLWKIYPANNVRAIPAATIRRFMTKVGVSCLPSIGGHWAQSCREEVDNAIMGLGVPLDTITVEKAQTLLAERGIHRCSLSVLRSMHRVRQVYQIPKLQTGS